MASGGRPSVEVKSYDLVPHTHCGVTAAGAYPVALNNASVYNAASLSLISQAVLPMAGGSNYGLTMVAASSGTCMLLNALTGVGAALNQRIGRKISMKSIKIDISFHPSISPSVVTGFTSTNAEVGLYPTTTQQSGSLISNVRVMLVYDRQTNGANVNYADVLAPLGGSGVGGSSSQVGVCSSNNLNNRSRFLTLFDKTYTVGVADSAPKKISIFKKLNLPVIYTGGSATAWNDYSTIQTGALLLLAVSDVDFYAPALILDATAVGGINFYSPYAFFPSARMRFTDA